MVGHYAGMKILLRKLYVSPRNGHTLKILHKKKKK